ncbi:hypothetical protein MTR_2g461530 [Medicago truncatula]|uniref:Uncharacterized protein n=1 Tax=Medicago truncatula TaxID=3880 RepID=A0A072V8E9_MEDTR|nr:hypothetical protein MTR_2g461530 [Medicago truncatula]
MVTGKTITVEEEEKDLVEWIRKTMLFHPIRRHGGRIDAGKMGDGGGLLKEDGRKKRVGAYRRRERREK